jgi:hypothetical protein
MSIFSTVVNSNLYYGFSKKGYASGITYARGIVFRTGDANLSPSLGSCILFTASGMASSTTYFAYGSAVNTFASVTTPTYYTTALTVTAASALLTA